MLGCGAHVRKIALPHVRCACGSACGKVFWTVSAMCVRAARFWRAMCDRTLAHFLWQILAINGHTFTFFVIIKNFQVIYSLFIQFWYYTLPSNSPDGVNWQNSLEKTSTPKKKSLKNCKTCECVCDWILGKMHTCVRRACGPKSSVRMCVRARQKFVATHSLEVTQKVPMVK